MTSTRFNPEKDLAPMPFDKKICHRALDMKKSREVDAVLSPLDVLLHIYGKIVNSLKHSDALKK